MGPELQAAIDELKGKVAGAERAMGKIADVETAVVEDRREFATTKAAMTEAIDKINADLESLPAKVREDFKTHLDSLPNPRKEREEDPGLSWRDMAKLKAADFALDGDDDRRPVVAGEGQAFRKSYPSPGEMRAKATVGASEPGTQYGQTHMIWHQAIVGDPWTAAGAYQMDLDAPNLVTVEASGINFDTNQNAAVSASSFDATIGAIAPSVSTVKTYVCRVLIPNEQEADLMGTIARLEMMMRLAYGKKRGGLTTAAISAGVKAANVVKTGVAATALTKANAMAKLLSLTAIGSLADYWADSPAYVLHPQDSVVLFEELAGKGGLTVDAVTGSARLGNWPIMVDPQAQANNVDDNEPDYFGAWNSAAIQAQRGRLVIDRYMQTVPGAVALYGAFRFIPVSVNNDAYAAIQVGA